jgi:hypothetical protein
MNLASLSKIGAREERFLAFWADGFSFRGGIVERGVDSFTVDHLVSSNVLSPGQALKEIVREYEMLEITLPKQGVVITRDVVVDLMYLPVDPGDARPAEEMVELVRWDLDDVQLGRASQWTVERALRRLGQGAVEMKGANESLGEGSLAAAAGLSDHGIDDLSSVTEIQQRIELLGEADSDLECVCRPTPSRVEEEYGWLAVGIRCHAADALREAFEQVSIGLAGIFPDAPLLAFKDRPDRGRRLSVEVNAERVWFTVVDSDGLQHLSHVEHDGAELPFDDVCKTAKTLVGGPDDEVILHAADDLMAADLALVADRLRLELAADSVQELRGLEAAASAIGDVVLRGRSRGFDAWLPGHPPPPPLHRRSGFKELAAVAVVILVTFGSEIFFAYRIAGLESQVENAGTELDQKRMAFERLEEEKLRVTTAESELAVVTARSAEVRERIRVLEELVGDRRRFLRGFFEALAKSTPPGLVIRSIEEESENRLRITGEAVDTRAAQYFIKRISALLTPYGRAIEGEVIVNNSQGRYGPQYDFDFDVVQRTEPGTQHR